MTQGSLDGNLHHVRVAQLEVPCRRRHVRRRRRRHHDAHGDGRRRWRTCCVELHRPDIAALRPRLLASLRRGIERDYIGQVSRDVVRLLQADANPGELVWEAVQHGAPRAEFGWGHVDRVGDRLPERWSTSTTATNERCPIVQAIAGIAETDRDRPVNPLPEPVAQLSSDPLADFRRRRRDRTTRAGPGARARRNSRWPRPPTSYGHGSPRSPAITCCRTATERSTRQKAFELLDMIGWDRADTVLPHLVPTIVYGTREDVLPYTRPFMRVLADTDLTALAALAVDAAVARRRHAPAHPAG